MPTPKNQIKAKLYIMYSSSLLINSAGFFCGRSGLSYGLLLFEIPKNITLKAFILMHHHNCMASPPCASDDELLDRSTEQTQHHTYQHHKHKASPLCAVDDFLLDYLFKSLYHGFTQLHTHQHRTDG